MKGPASGALKRRTEPLPGEIELLKLVGGGMLVSRAAKKLKISPHTAHDRIRRLKYMAQRDSIAALVHWGLTKHYFEYNYKKNIQEISPIQVQIIQKLAMDQSEAQIGKAMSLTENQIQGNLKRARWATGATNRPNLVAICWMEGWIV